MVQLQHIFAKGVRFDTELEYLVQAKQALRYAKLPIKPSRSVLLAGVSGDGGHGQDHELQLSLAQCLAVVGQLPFRQVQGLISGMALTDADLFGKSTQIDLAGRCFIVRGVSNPASLPLGVAALQCLREGHVGLLQFATASQTHWVMVIGVEWESGRDSGRPLALLLLDSQASEPWACGHNARIELLDMSPRTARSVRARPGFDLAYRGLDGKGCAVQVLGLVSVELKPG